MATSAAIPVTEFPDVLAPHARHALRELVQRLGVSFWAMEDVYLIGSSLTRSDPRDYDVLVIDGTAIEIGFHVVQWRMAGGILLVGDPPIVVDLKIMERKLAERGGFLRGPILRLDGRQDARLRQT